MSDIFSGAQRRLSELIRPDGLKSAALHYLREGGETVAMAALEKCEIEYGDIPSQQGLVYQINITLRCRREILKKLQPANDTWKTETELKKQLAEAIRVSLPSGYDIANLDARAMAMTGHGGAGLDEKTRSLLNYDSFIKPESLALMGREIVPSLLSPFASDFSKLKIKLPDPGLPDAEYFPALSKVLSAKAKMPLGLIDKISAILELAMQVANEFEAEQKKELEKYLEVPLRHRATGHGLISSLANVQGHRPDYPEKLDPLQSELVGEILQYVGDYLDISNDMEPADVLKYENEVSIILEKLEKAGLLVFTGNYTTKHVFENGQDYKMPSAIVLVAEANSPRIKIDPEGRKFVRGLIEKGPADKKQNPASAQPPSQVKRTDENPHDRKIVENFEFLAAELREFRKTMADSASRKATVSESDKVSTAQDGRTIKINGKALRLYRVTLWPLHLTLENRSIHILFKSRPFEIEEQRKVLAPLFLGGNVSLNGLKEKPDPREKGVGDEQARMLKATLEFPNREPMQVYCDVRPHTFEEGELVFQEKLRSSATIAVAGGSPTHEEKSQVTAAVSTEKPVASETLIVKGRLSYRQDCSLILYDNVPFNLQKRKKAQACLRFMTEKGAFSTGTALHLENEINPAVLKDCGFGTKYSVKIQGYFANAGKLTKVAKKFIASAGKGKYYLKTD